MTQREQEYFTLIETTIRDKMKRKPIKLQSLCIFHLIRHNNEQRQLILRQILTIGQSKLVVKIDIPKRHRDANQEDYQSHYDKLVTPKYIDQSYRYLVRFIEKQSQPGPILFKRRINKKIFTEDLVTHFMDNISVYSYKIYLLILNHINGICTVRNACMNHYHIRGLFHRIDKIHWIEPSDCNGLLIYIDELIPPHQLSSCLLNNVIYMSKLISLELTILFLSLGYIIITYDKKAIGTLMHATKQILALHSGRPYTHGQFLKRRNIHGHHVYNVKDPEPIILDYLKLYYIVEAHNIINHNTPKQKL